MTWSTLTRIKMMSDTQRDAFHAWVAYKEKIEKKIPGIKNVEGVVPAVR